MHEPTTDLRRTPEPADVYTAHIERRLLLLSGAFLTVNLLALLLVRGLPLLSALVPLVVWSLCAAAGHVTLNRWLGQRDALLFPLAMFLSGWGLILIKRLAPPFADRQAVWLLLAVAAMSIVAVLPHILHWLKAFRYMLLLFGLSLLMATILLGSNPSGQPGAPQLWLGFNGAYFQPSELLKVILVAFLASYLAEQYPLLRAEGLEFEQHSPASRHTATLSPRIVGPILLMWGLSIVVLVWQRDLGTAALFFIVFLLLLYVASGYTPLLLSGGLLILLAGFAAYQLFDVVRLRVDVWVNPWLEAEGRAYQIVQSLMAFSAGGVFGQGIGQGAPTLIPVVHSDFAFAAVAEEWGLLGVVVVVTVIMMIVARGLRIASEQQEKPFYALLSVGLSLLIAAQSLLIMGGVLKLVPLTGVTLPFLSYGGSSLVVSFVIIGLLLRLSSGDN